MRLSNLGLHPGRPGIPAAGASGITVFGTVAAALEDNTSGQVVSLPGTLEENDVVVLLMGRDSATAITAPTEGGYTQEVTNDIANVKSSIFTKRMGATPDTTATFDVGGSGNNIDTTAIIFVFRGVNTTTLLDVALPVRSFGTGTSASPPDITTITDGCMIWTGMVLDDRVDQVFTAPAGYDNLTQVNTTGSVTLGVGSAASAKLQETAGLEDPGTYNWQLSGTNYHAYTMALRPA